MENQHQIQGATNKVGLRPAFISQQNTAMSDEWSEVFSPYATDRSVNDYLQMLFSNTKNSITTMSLHFFQNKYCFFIDTDLSFEQI